MKIILTIKGQEIEFTADELKDLFNQLDEAKKILDENVGTKIIKEVLDRYPIIVKDYYPYTKPYIFERETKTFPYEVWQGDNIRLKDNTSESSEF